MRQYEVGVIFHPDLEMDFEGVTKKVAGIITGLGGKVLATDSWGKRKLAYPIKKQDWGLYAFMQIELDPEQVQALDNTLRITDEVMRYIVVSLDDVRPLQKNAAKRKKPAEIDSKAEDSTESTK